MEKKDPYWLRMLTIIVLALLAWAFMILVALLFWEVGKFLVVRLASPLDSGVANREAMVSANKAEDAGFRAHQSFITVTKLVTFASYR